MFFLRRLLGGTRGPGNDNPRRVFKYRDGARTRSVDPLAVERVMAEVAGTDWREQLRALAAGPAADLGLVGELAASADADRAATRRKLLQAVCAAFGVTEYTDHGGTAPPTGLTETELWELVGGYGRFCADLVRLAAPFASARSRASPSPGSPPPASGPDSTSAAGPSAVPAPTT